MRRQSRKVLAFAALTLVSVWTAACGDGGSTEPAPTPNRPPAASGSIPDVTVAVGETEEVNAAGYFADPDGDALAYSARSSSTAVASVSVSGSVVSVTAIAAGTATVAVTARDPAGLSAQLTFAVTVPNREPAAIGTVAAQTVFVGDSVSVDVSAHFSDPDGDALVFTAASGDAATASVSVSGSLVEVAGAAPGTTTVTVTATDSGGLSARQEFAVMVPNREPVAVGTVSAQTVLVGDSVSVDVSEHFSDPDGEALAYSATSSDAATAAVSMSGSVATVVGVAQGTAAVTVTATDPGELSAQLTFTVAVPNRRPVAGGAIPAQTVLVGDTVSVDVSAHFSDPDGDALAYSAASSDAAVASVSLEGSVAKISGVLPGATTVTVTATDPGGLLAQQEVAVTVPNRTPVAVGTIPAQTVTAGNTVSINVSGYFSDPDGEQLTYAAASSNAAVATVAIASGSVAVAGVAEGTATVTVTATDPGGMTAEQQFAVSVTERQGAPVVVAAIADLAVAVGERRTWKGAEHFHDPDGDPLTYVANSSNAAVVSASVSGGDFAISALSVGMATVTVTASDPGGRSTQLSFQVTVGAGPTVAITGIAPAVLVEGEAATITGTGFAATASQNQVTVGGAVARVTSASATSLSIAVPVSDCQPPRRAEVKVQVGNGSDSTAIGITPLSREDIDLPAGWYRYTFRGNGCLHLPGGEYMIGVVSTSERPTSMVSVAMTSTPGDATVLGNTAATAPALPHAQRAATVELFADGLLPTLTAAPSSVPEAAWPTPRQDATGPPSHWEQHAEITARNQETVRRLGHPPALAASVRSQSVAQGDTVSLFADADHDWTCSTPGEVRAVVRLTGTNTVWLEDIDNPAVGFTDSELAGLDAFYASDVKPVHDAYYGNLSDVDRDGRLWVLMTKEVNRRNLGGWVWFYDLYPTTSCAASNHREIFYGLVPDPAGTFGSTWTRQATLDYYPSLLAHEVTHLVQGNAHVFGSARGTTWELEGGATLAEQLVAYRLFGHGSGREMGYAEYERGIAWYYKWVSGLARFFGWDSESGSGRVAHAPEQCSWVGRPAQGNTGPCSAPERAVYDVPSMVYRYAMDRWSGAFPGGETALMRRLTQSPEEGFEALKDASSWRIEQILADFYLALWVDLNGGRSYGMTTWNLQDIWSSLNRNYQLLPDTSSSARIAERWKIRAGSSSFLHWTPTGPHVPATVKVTFAGSVVTPNVISVWAYRIR